MAPRTDAVKYLIAKLLNYGPLTAKEQSLLAGVISSEREVPPIRDWSWRTPPLIIPP
jgi:hypothetical protein